MEGKIFNYKRMSFLGIATLIVFLTAFCISNFSSKKSNTDNLETHLGEANQVVSAAQSPISGDDLVKEALQFMIDQNGSGKDCSTFVAETLERLGAKGYAYANKVDTSIISWNAGSVKYYMQGASFDYKMTELGWGYSSSETPWYEKINIDVASLQAGTVISGTKSSDGTGLGHVFIYIGQLQANSKSEVQNWLKTKYGIEVDQKYIENPSSNYWYIEGNGNQGLPIRVRSYDWRHTNGNAKTMNYVHVWQVTNFGGQYSLSIAKKDKSNPDGPSLAGAKFNYSKKISSSTSVENKTITTTGNNYDIIASNVEVTSVDEYNNSYDFYSFSEFEAPEGYQIGGDGTWNVGLRVYKGKIETTGKYGAKYVQVIAGNEIPESADFRVYPGDSKMLSRDLTETTVKKDANIKIEVSADGANVNFIWQDPPEKGTYSMNLVKKDIDTDQVVQFANFKIFQKLNVPPDGSIDIDENNESEDVKCIFRGSPTNKVWFNTNPGYNGSDGMDAFASNVRINELNPDIYIIEEVEAPDGYKIIGKDKRLVIAVYKTYNSYSEQYEIAYIYVTLGDSTVTTYTLADIESNKTKVTPNQSIYFDENWNKTDENDKYMTKISLDRDSTDVYITWRDPKLEGSYDVYLGKKNSEDLNGDYVPGIRYNVLQSVDKNDDDGGNEVKGTGLSAITTNNLIKIVDSQSITAVDGYYDSYTFEELDASDVKFIANTYSPTINVYKHVNESKDKYEIDYITYEYNDGENHEQKIEAGQQYWILSDYSAKLLEEVTEQEKKDAVAYVTLATNRAELTFVGINKPVTKGSYDLYFAKTTSDNLYGLNNYVAGFKYKINEKEITTTKSPINIAKELTSKDSYEISDSNVNNTDTFSIKELDNTDKGYMQCTKDIVISLEKTKKTGDDGKAYYALSTMTLNVSGKLSEKIELGTAKVDIWIKADGTTVVGNNSNLDYTECIAHITAMDHIIQFIGIDQPIEGIYDLQIKKINNATGEVIPGVKFKVDGDLANKLDYLHYTAATDENGLTYVADDVKISKDTVNNTDEYVIKEVDLGDNNNLVKLNEDITILVSKTLNKDAYVVNSAKFKLGSETFNNGTPVTQTVQLEDGRLVIASLEIKNGVITVTIPNEIKGDYTLNIGKRSYNDLISTDNSTFIAGSKFTVEQYLNSTTTVESNLTNRVENITSEKGKATSVWFNKKNASGNIVSSNVVDITDVSIVDTYKITETKEPDGYILDSEPIIIKVKKVLDTKNGAYTIDEIEFAGENDTYYTTRDITEAVTGNEDSKIRYYRGYDSDGDVKQCIVALDKTTNTITYVKTNKIVEGSYNFVLTKVDYLDRTIKSEVTKFDVNVYKTYTENNGTVTLSDQVQLYKFGNLTQEITTTDLLATTGQTVGLNGIAIRKIDYEAETYYFKVTETQAPDKYTEINYEVVVPVSFSKVENKYIATQGEAFALVNGNTKKTLAEMENQYGKAAKLEDQIGVTINLKVPNKEKEGTYKFKLVKVDLDGNDIGPATFSVKAYSNMKADNTFSGLITLKDKEGNTIKTDRIEVTGEQELDEIAIQHNQIDKTYYFVVDEITAPSNCIKIDYKVVIPVTYSDDNGDYKATYGDAFAVTSNGVKKTLDEMANSDNKKVKVQPNGNMLTLTVPNSPKKGTFNFVLTKIDVNNVEIEDEKTTFKVDVYDSVESNGNIVFGNAITLKNNDDIDIDTSKLITHTGANAEINNIKIQDDYLNKTYYFVVEETNAPDDFTKIDYLVVVPVSFSVDGDEYVAKQGTAFAIVNENGTEKKKSLSELESEYNKVAELENQIGASINLKVPNTPKAGKYNFVVTKIDDDGEIIESEVTRFDVTVYDSITEQNSKVVYGNVVELKNGIPEFDDDVSVINTKNIDAYTGAKAEINGIAIQPEDIGKTYYFVVDETVAPDDFTKIDYRVVVPITYSEDANGYKATQGTAFAIKNEEKKSLESISGEYNSVAELKEQVGITINLLVPNTPEDGTYNFKLTKVNTEGTQLNSDGIRFNISVYKKMVQDGNNVNFSRPVTLENQNGEIDTSDLNGNASLDGIIINSTDIGNTYYYVIEEKTTIYPYIKLDYKVVVPVEFVKVGNDYKAIEKDAFALVNNVEKKSLQEVVDNNNELVTVNQNGDTINVTVPNIKGSGAFNFKILKLKAGTTKPIKNAGFKITIADLYGNSSYAKDKDGNIIDGTKEYFSDINGYVEIEDIQINDLATYQVTIVESTVPQGYEASSAPIQFTVNTVLEGKEYKLVPNEMLTIQNTKIVKIRANEVLVEKENFPIPEIHKGVKEVYNQDSGYDDGVLHDWVIQTTIPTGIDKYSQYYVNDIIDRRLDFAGVDTVKVNIIDKNGDLIKNLVAGTDYQVSYSEGTRLLKVTFIQDDFIAGKNLPVGTGDNAGTNKIEIRFNTTFAKDDQGNIIALGEFVPNQTELIYENEAGVSRKLSEVPEVHTGGVKVIKYLDVNGSKTPLAGAIFKLALTEEDAYKGKYIKQKDKYGVDSGNDIFGESDSDGIVKFVGLEFGGDAMSNNANKKIDAITGTQVFDYEFDENVNSTYWIVETRAPEGYILDPTPKQVTISKDSYDVEISQMTEFDNEAKSGRYELKLIKVTKDGDSSTETPLDNVTFNVSSSIPKNNRPITTGSDGTAEISNDVINIVPNEVYSKNVIANINNTSLSKVDTYKITETNADGYLKLKNAIQLKVYKQEKNNEYKMSSISIYEIDSETEEIIQSKSLNISYGQKETVLSGVKLEDDISTVDITFNVDNDNLVTMKIPNVHIDGNYKILLKKVNAKTGMAIGNIPFKINGEVSNTHPITGIVNVTDEDGVEINKLNKDTADVYEIKELESEATTNIVILSDPITLTVNKGSNSNNSSLIVTSIKIKTITASGEKEETINVDTDTQTGYGTFYAKTKDGYDVKCTVDINSNGEILIKAGNPEKDGDYKLQLQKTVNKENGTEEPLTGVSFTVKKELNSGTSSVSLLTSNGVTATISGTIDSDNVNTPDVYTISEVNTGNNSVVKLANNIRATVTKGSNANNDKYTLKTIKLEEVSQDGSTVIKTSSTVTVIEGEGVSVTLPEVSLADGRKIDVTASVDSNNLVVVKIPNKEIVGDYIVKVKKVNSATGEAMNGVTFKGFDSSRIPYQVVTTNDATQNGIATIAEEHVTYTTSKTYTINEYELPTEYAGKVLQVTDFGYEVNIKTKLNNEKTAYVIDENNVSVRAFQKNASLTTDRQKQIAEKVEYDVKDNVVTITVYNEPTEDYSFKIKKVDWDGNALAGAKFTIYENGNLILGTSKTEGADISNIGEYLVERSHQLINSTYTYEIYETEAAQGYENIFEHIVIVLTINIDNSQNVSATYTLKPNYENGGSAGDLSIVKQRILSELPTFTFLVDNGDNDYTLNIPNPTGTVSTNFTLTKHEQDSENGVEGAVFRARKVIVQDEEVQNVSGVIEKLDADQIDSSKLIVTTFDNSKNLLIDSEGKMKIGDSYYYEISEESRPNNYKSKFKKVLVRAHANIDGTITSQIVGIMSDDATTWNLSPENDSAIQLTTNGNNVNLSWENTPYYTVVLNKKQGTEKLLAQVNGNISSLPTLSGSTFKIRRVDPTTKEQIGEDILSGDEPIGMSFDFTNKIANSNTTYCYEFEELATVEGYSNIFEGVKIYVYVVINKEGKIDKESTKFELSGDLTPERKKYLEDMILLNPSDTILNLYIANVQNTLAIKLMKVAATATSDNLIGIPDVEFAAYKGALVPIHPDGQDSGNFITDDNGYAYIDDITPNSGTVRYLFKEVNVPEGVTMLNGVSIIVDVDTNGMVSPEDITEDRVTVTISRDSAEAVDLDIDATVQGSTILLKVPNTADYCTFNMFKYDDEGSILTGAEFKIEQLINGTYEEIPNTLEKDGFFVKSNLVQPNTAYDFKISEISTPDGYINVLEGYNLYVHIEIGADGLVSATSQNGVGGYTHYTLEEVDGKEQKFSQSELIDKYLNLATSSEQTSTVKKSTVDLRVKNPYGYKLQINKKNGNGSSDVDKAKITAEEISDADAYNLFYAGERYDSESMQETLLDIANSGNVSNTINMNKVATITSDLMHIDLNSGMAPVNGTAKVWRIKETDVEAPYVNILKDKFIIVEAIYRLNNLQVISHNEDIDGSLEEFNYYVTDADGNNLTVEYSKYVDVDVIEVDDVKTISVTIKDPSKIKVDLTKVEYQPNISDYSDFVELGGAELSIGDVQITNGNSKSETLEHELSPGENVTYIIRESSSAPGHKNILKDKFLAVTVLMPPNSENISINTVVVENGTQLTGSAKENVMKFIKIEKTTDDQGYPFIHVYIENPIETKFKLIKRDTDGNELEGTEFTVLSSHSGTHYLDKQSSMSFTEENVLYGEPLDYVITETRAVENSAYQNVFNKPIYVYTKVNNNGEIEIKDAYMRNYTPSGGRADIELDDIEYLDYRIETDEEGIQTMVFEMQNPVNVDVELLKLQDGDNAEPIANTNFTIVSTFSGEHNSLTNQEGKIDFTEEKIKPGQYSYKIYENATADAKYINILYGKYMQADVEVFADGTIRINNVRYFNTDGSSVDDEMVSKLRQYTNVWVDTSNPVHKLMFKVINPVTIKFELIKKDTYGDELKNVKFKINSPISGEHISNTNAEGKIVLDEDQWIKPGVYKYEITELESIGLQKQYDNLLENYKIVAFVKVDPDGIASLVADEEGNEFSHRVEYKYYVQKLDGSEAENDVIDRVHMNFDIDVDDISSDIDVVEAELKNTVGYNMNIIKKNSAGNEISGSKFTVIRDGSKVLLNRKTITAESEFEVSERYMNYDEYRFDITEDSTVENSAYVNILKGKFVRVYTKILGDGTVKIINDNGEIDDDYFEIYEGNVRNQANISLLDRNENKELYDEISVRAHDDNRDGEYTIELSVENPINIDVEVDKKQYTTEGIGIANTKFTMKRDDQTSAKSYTTNENGIFKFTEEKIKPGDYIYTVMEEQTASNKYVNILENKYMEVYINIAEDGKVTLKNSTGYKIFNNNGTEVDSNTLSKLSNFISVKVDVTNPTNKLLVTIYNPPTIVFDLYKKDIDGNVLGNTNFTITKSLVNSYYANYTTDPRAVRENTDETDGMIEIDEKIIVPGIYRYEITENETAGNQYINVLNGCKLVAYVEVDGAGNASVVANSSGTRFSQNMATNYYIESTTGATVDAETKDIIHKYIEKVYVDKQNNSKDRVYVEVVNPILTRLDIVKKDERKKALDGTKFSVSKSVAGSDTVTVNVLDKADVTEEIELEEKYLESGDSIYYITEDETKAGYINKLDGMFIKAYTTLKSNGKLTVYKFEIWKGSVNDLASAEKLDATEYKKIYDLVDVYTRAEDDVYVLVVEVINPDLNYNVVFNKKIFGEEGINLSNTQFAITSSFSGRHSNIVTDNNGNISFMEKNVPAGLYWYEIRETRAAGDQFVNILGDDKYIVVNLKVRKDGTIEVIDEEGTEIEGKYYIYQQTDNPRYPEEIKPEDTVIDEFVKVDTSMYSEDIPQLDIFMKNPELYNFELIKKDKDTNKRMNGVEFEFTAYEIVKDGTNRAELKDANTLENLVSGTLETERVNGIDGVIALPNILIEKAGSYIFVFKELSTENASNILYKSWASDIRIRVDIEVKDGEYVVGETPSVLSGNQYVEFVDVSSTRAQLVASEVTNERIKGSYDLIIDKVDSYTGKSLDGAEFDITVEKDIDNLIVYDKNELYKSTDDVEQMDVVVPGHYAVDGTQIIENIRIEQPETYVITLTETKAPDGYMLLDEPIRLEVTTGIEGEYDDAKYVIKKMKLLENNNHNLISVDYNGESIHVIVANEYFDLALRKSITSVEYDDGTDDGKITEEMTENRIPDVVTDGLVQGLDTTASYNHVKNHVGVYAGQEVIFTLRVYNEGEIDGYAEEITDHLPEGLEFVNDDFNAERGWKYDENDTSLRTVKTTFLSKEKDPENNLIKAMDKRTGELDYKGIQIKCRISENVTVKTVLTNIAEITDSIAEGRSSQTVDRDSVTNNVEVPDSSDGMSNYKEDELTDDRNSYVPGQEDDDDFEKLIVEEFDLALRKYITAVNDEELLNTKGDDVKYYREPRVNVDSLKDGSSTTATYTHPKEEEPVEVSVDDIVTYTIQIFNEGTVSGYASLIKDDIPEGLEFVTYTKGDGSINDIYRWKMIDKDGNEVTNAKEAKYVISDYLSKDNEIEPFGNLISAFDSESMSTVDSKYVKVAFRVVCKQDYPKLIKNEAQISDDTDGNGGPVKDRDSTPDEWLEEDDEDVDFVKVTYMDLALRKFITGVTDAASGKTQEITSRIPQVDATALIKETGTTAKYEHTKEPVLVHTNDVVIYTLRVYNEGSKDGYATQIKDDLPDGLEYLPNHEINKQYEWVLVDENDKLVSDISKAKYAVTNYLSKDNETVQRQSLMKAFDKETMKTPEYKDIKIAFKVTEPTTSDRILTNEAQISEQTDGKGVHREDRDSTPNEWLGEDDEDVEHVKVQYFDLALRKWVTKAIVSENGKTTVTETGHKAEDNPEAVVKVDLKKSKINSVVVKFEYQIRVTNEGEIAGYADEVKDYIPQGLKFDPSDNPNWTKVTDNEVVTDELKDTLLQPGESSEVTIVLTWINSESNMGLKVNIAEISKDRNDYGTPDIDSTPNNGVPGEDDIDDAPVMLTVKTGAQTTAYIALGLAIIMIIGTGVKMIKRF